MTIKHKIKTLKEEFFVITHLKINNNYHLVVFLPRLFHAYFINTVCYTY